MFILPWAVPEYEKVQEKIKIVFLNFWFVWTYKNCKSLIIRLISATCLKSKKPSVCIIVTMNGFFGVALSALASPFLQAFPFLKLGKISVTPEEGMAAKHVFLMDLIKISFCHQINAKKQLHFIFVLCDAVVALYFFFLKYVPSNSFVQT